MLGFMCAMNVVIVDDSPSTLKHFAALVAALPGCAPLAFTDPAEALEAVLDCPPDLVLLDYEMPRPNGLEFLEAFRRTQADIPVVMVTACTLREVRHRALELGATDFLTKPVDDYEFTARVRNLLSLRQAHLALADRAAWLAEAVARAMREEKEREREAVLCLARAAEHRDPETADHLVRMAQYAKLIAEQLGLAEKEVELLHLAAPMHDVGKIGIPDSILLKPGKLDPDEFDVMKRHTVIGARILSGYHSPLLQVAAAIALAHHERFDGSGYPGGLAGEAIPLVGRITAVADVFDALTTTRPYKRAWPLGEAYDYVTAGAGSHFDPTCVAAFVARWPEIAEFHEDIDRSRRREVAE